MFSRSQILVVGSGLFAQRIAGRLRQAGRPSRRVDRLDLTGWQLRSLGTLILTDPAQDAGERIERLSEACRHRSASYRRLRVILVGNWEGDVPTPVPPEGSNLTVETFDPEAQAARALLARAPPHSGMDPPYGQIPHVLIAGRSAPASALLVQLLRVTHYGDERPVFTLASEDPQAYAEGLHATYPQAGQLCRLRFAEIDAVDLDDAPPVTGAFVCLTPPEAGLAVARRIAARILQLQGVSPLIHLEIGDAQPEGGPADWEGQILPFSWLKDAFSLRVLLDGEIDQLARIVHEHYQDSIAAQGRDGEMEAAGLPWEHLGGSYRDASRHQADHLSAKLSTLDCRAVPEELVETFTFAPLEVERLAAIEHRRWAADRYLDGWTYARERDNERKHHPQLIPYADLTEPMKDLDRFAVRLAPTLLARSGRGLVRILLVAVIEPVGDLRADRRMRRLVDKALLRLVASYPDRSVVLASTLIGTASRLVVRRAMDGFEAGLFLLCPRPLTETLAAQAGDRECHELLELAARAERRIALPGAGEPDAWFARRAEIGLLLGTGTEAEMPVKQMLLDPGAGRMDWSFEY